MHNGYFDSLRSVIVAYDQRMLQDVPKNKREANDPALPQRDILLKTLNLTNAEMEALEAFLQTL